MIQPLQRIQGAYFPLHSSNSLYRFINSFLLLLQYILTIYVYILTGNKSAKSWATKKRVINFRKFPVPVRENVSIQFLITKIFLRLKYRLNDVYLLSSGKRKKVFFFGILFESLYLLWNKHLSLLSVAFYSLEIK